MENDKFQELVLTQLEALNAYIGQLSRDVSDLKQGQARLEQRQEALEQGQHTLQEGQKRIELLQEDMNKKLKLLAEGLEAHREHNERQFTELREFIKEEHGLLKSIVKHNSSEILALKRVTGKG